MKIYVTLIFIFAFLLELLQSNERKSKKANRIDENFSENFMKNHILFKDTIIYKKSKNIDENKENYVIKHAQNRAKSTKSNKFDYFEAKELGNFLSYDIYWDKKNRKEF